MGLFDILGKLGTALEDGFTPVGERERNRALREQVLLSKFAREQETRRSESLNQLVDNRTRAQSTQANSNLLDSVMRGVDTGSLNLGDSANNILSGVSSARNEGINAQRGGEQLSLLAQAAPDQVAQALLAEQFPQAQQGRAEPGDIRTLRAIGIDPSSPEGRKIILDRLKSNGGTEEQIGLLNARLKVLDLEEKKKAADRRDDDEAADLLAEEKARLGKQVAISSTIQDVELFAQANSNLTGTVLQPGNVALPAREVVNSLFAEFGDEEAAARQTDFNTFEKFSAGGAFELAQSLNQQGALSDAKLAQAKSAFANIGADPTTNNRIIANFLRDVLDDAKVNGIDLPEAPRIRLLIKRLKGLETDREKLDRLREEQDGG